MEGRLPSPNSRSQSLPNRHLTRTRGFHGPRYWLAVSVPAVFHDICELIPFVSNQRLLSLLLVHGICRTLSVVLGDSNAPEHRGGVQWLSNHYLSFDLCASFYVLCPLELSKRWIVKNRIVIVEDNADTRLLLKAILEDYYDTIMYATGFEALQGLRQEAPELILLDISLPGMDGIEVLSNLRSDPRLKNIPVLALTAHAMTGDREKYITAGFNDYVTKPIIDEEILLRAIRKWLTAAQ